MSDLTSCFNSTTTVPAAIISANILLATYVLANLRLYVPQFNTDLVLLCTTNASPVDSVHQLSNLADLNDNWPHYLAFRFWSLALWFSSYFHYLVVSSFWMCNLVLEFVTLFQLVYNTIFLGSSCYYYYIIHVGVEYWEVLMMIIPFTLRPKGVCRAYWKPVRIQGTVKLIWRPAARYICD